MRVCGTVGYSVALAILNLTGTVLRILPAGFSRATGWLLGMIWYYVFRVRRTVVFDNLEKVFPGQWRTHPRIARAFYRNFCTNIVEFIGTHPNASIVRDVSVEGMEHFHRAESRGRGVIVVTAHLGNFDLLACNRAMDGIPLGLVSKTFRQGAVNDFWMTRRKQLGVRVFEEGAPPIEVVRWLRAGKVLGLVVDQRLSPTRGGIPVPFFGYKVWTSPAAARLAMVSGAALLPVMIHRHSGGHHRVVIEPEIIWNARDGHVGHHVSEDRKNEADIHDLMTRISRIVERWIRMYPDEWMWIHRRFKNAKKIRPAFGSTDAPAEVFLKKTIA